MAEFQLPKLATRVRFPSPAPKQNPFRGFFFSLSFGNLCSKLVAFALSLKFSLSHRKSSALLRPLDALVSFPSPAPSEIKKSFSKDFFYFTMIFPEVVVKHPIGIFDSN